MEKVSTPHLVGSTAAETASASSLWRLGSRRGGSQKPPAITPWVKILDCFFPLVRASLSVREHWYKPARLSLGKGDGDVIQSCGALGWKR